MEEGEDEEWMDYSSPCFAQSESNQQDISTENLTDESLDEEPLPKVERKPIKPRDIPDLLHRLFPEQHAFSPSQCNTDVLKLSAPSLWGKLVAKLNSVRHTKWHGSCLEYSYHRSLNVSPAKTSEKLPQINADEYGEHIFNFHAMNIYPSRTERDDKTDSLNKDIEYIDRSIYNGKSSSNTSLEDISPELEWSDNDVKDELIDNDLGNVSISVLSESEAASDLAQLPYKELLDLRNELKEYTKQYSDILVVELETRDQYIREKEVKNDFISSFLAVQAKTREALQTANKKKFSLQSSSISNNQSLTTTIPYEIQSEGPSTDILEKLIEIMEAMRVDSSNVPSLLTNYILKVLCK